MKDFVTCKVRKKNHSLDLTHLEIYWNFHLQLLHCFKDIEPAEDRTLKYQQLKSIKSNLDRQMSLKEKRKEKEGMCCVLY